MSTPTPTRPSTSMTRQPSRLSVVSSALSSADEDERIDAGPSSSSSRRKPTINYNEAAEDDEEDEDELSDISEDEVDEDDSPAPAKSKGKVKPTPSLKVTLGGANRKSASTAKVSNNRGVKIVQSEEEDSTADAEAEADSASEDELDELDPPPTVIPAPAALDSEDDEEEYDSEGEVIPRASNIPKTARQLARESDSSHLMQLPMSDDSKKVKLSDAELALKRSETARRRRYQSEKKLDDEKTETINRLLKKQVGRKSNRSKEDDEEDDEDEGEESDAKRAKLNAASELTRQQAKDMPKPFYRVVIGQHTTTVSVPLGQEAYVKAWDGAFR